MAALGMLFRTLVIAATAWGVKDVVDIFVNEDEDPSPIPDKLAEKAEQFKTIGRWIAIGSLAVTTTAFAIFKMTKAQRKKLLK